MNKTKFFELHYESRSLIENAFQLNPRAQMRYSELQEQESREAQVLFYLVEDILSGTPQRGSNKFAAMYLNSVKDEIAMLLRAKEYINSALQNQIGQLVSTRQKVLAFHLSIALIAMLAVTLCLTLYCCSFRYFNMKALISLSHSNSNASNLTREDRDNESVTSSGSLSDHDNVYKVDDKSQIVKSKNNKSYY